MGPLPRSIESETSRPPASSPRTRFGCSERHADPPIAGAAAPQTLRGLSTPHPPSPAHPPAFSIVLPCLNEAESLPRLVAGIDAVMRGRSYEIVFVDDGSLDCTWDAIAACLQSHRDWQAVRLSRRFGHQAAILAGLAAARGRAVVTMDADGQHPARLLPEMIGKWLEGCKVVQTIRLPTDAEPWLKRTTSRLFYRIFSALCDVRITGASADFRLLDRAVVDSILASGGPVPFFRGLIPWLGYPTAELPYRPDPRIAGQTKYAFGRMLRLAVDGLVSFSIVPLRLGIWAGLLFGALSFIYLCYVAAVGLFSDAVVPGWASTAGLVALLGGVQLFCVGLLGEYLGRLYTLHLDRPRFVVQEWIKPEERSCDTPPKCHSASTPASGPGMVTPTEAGPPAPLADRELLPISDLEAAHAY